jgi:3'-phosphoadenosine 5'-phosphosulfate sulfotransferase (PAPS reductase)/FAD synthetase
MPTGVYDRLSGEKMKEKLRFMKCAQAQPLEQKIEITNKIIEEMAKKGPMAIMFSGGRDSCALATLAAKHNPTLLHCDTGLATAGAGLRLKEIARQLKLNLVIVRPETDAYTMWQTLGHYPIGPKRGHTYIKRKTNIKSSPVQCCYRLKEVPAKKYIREHKIASILWGNRAEDSNRRKLGIADNGMISPPSSRWPCFSAQPIALFRDEDVAKIISPLGQRHIARGEDGCQVCCTDLGRKDNQLTRCMITDPETFRKAILSGLGEQILKARGEEHEEENIKETLENTPHKFLRIPRFGKND